MMNSAVIWVLLAIILIGAGLAVVMGLSRRAGGGLDQDEFRSRWMQLNAGLAKDNPSSWQVALMEADKLLDQALIAKGASGNTLG